MHPDWSQVTGPLRIELPERGWSTLAIQLPVLDKEASYYDNEDIFPEAVPRTEAAIDFLQAQGSERIALIAHSCGAHMSMARVELQGTADIDADIGIGMGATDYKQPMRNLFPYNRVAVTLLNVVGSEDYPAVLRQAELLESIMDDLPAGSAQRHTEGAGHYFYEQSDELVEAISGWLEETAAQG